jgi:glycosyltransferase involved in cell wall biosynthesis
MKICMFTNTYLPHVGGVARSVAAFTEDLREMGNDVLVIAPEYSDSDRQSENEHNVIRVPAIQNFNGSDFSVRIPVPFIIDDAIDNFKPDVIHSHHPYLLGDAALRAARRRKLPLIFTHHTLYEEYTHYVSSNSDNMKKFTMNLSTEYANTCTGVIAPSLSIARLIKKRGVISRVVEIPTGVDVGFFSEGQREKFREEFKIPKNAFVIGHLGRLAPEKNLIFLARAISDAMRDLPNARFLIVGKGPSETEIIHTFQKKGLKDRLIVAGKQTGNRLRDAYHAMDLFVFASKTETQGIVLIEAMAAGLPVIAINASGTREVVSNSKNGILLPSDVSEKLFAETVRDAILDHEKMSPWKNVAIKTAHKFDRKKCTQKLYQFYQMVIANSTRTIRDENGYLNAWENLLDSIQAEWDLISEKVRAVVKTISSNRDELHHDE